MRRTNGYDERVNRVLDYIGEHLETELSLARLSRVGGFSPFHFHRIFQSVTGETLNAHVRRVRLERAVMLMKAAPRKRLTDIALQSGFGGTAEFSRDFRTRYGRTASSWDRRTPLENSKICKAPESHPVYSLEELERWKADAKVRVRLQPFGAFRYVYIRVFEPYGSTRLVDAYHSLRAWLAARQTNVGDIAFIGMSLDDPAVTPAANCRYDLGIAFPKLSGGDSLLAAILRLRGRNTLAALPAVQECSDAGFSTRDFASHDAAAIHCIGDLGQMDRAWNFLYRMWLPSVAYEPADRPAMEVFVRLPEEIGWETFDLQVCIPVVRP